MEVVKKSIKTEIGGELVVKLLEKFIEAEIGEKLVKTETGVKLYSEYGELNLI